jgi:transmembrane sensor
MAASVAALAFGIRVVGLPGPSPTAEYRAPDDGPRTVTLEDGTFVRLAAGSQIRVRETEEERGLSLEGRAFFAVTRDETRPFVVRTSSGDVTVLGTRFEVAEEAASTRTIVVEGRVGVSNAHGSVEVPAGSLARMPREGAPAMEVPEDIWALLDWSEGVLVFQDTPLADVAREVSRHFRRPFTVSDPELGNRRITAWFQVEPFHEVVESICMVVDATCATDGDGVVAAPRDESGGGR